MVAATYWRVFPGAVQARISELEMATSPGGGNVCTGGTAIKSSETASYEATKAFDTTKGGTNSWASAATGDYALTNYVGYQFASPADIQEIRIWTSSAGTLPVQMIAQYSEDGITWRIAAQYWQTFNYSSSYTFAVPDIADHPNLLTTQYSGQIPTPITWPPATFGRALTRHVGPNAVRVASFHRGAFWTGTYHIAGSVISGGVGIKRRVVLTHQASQYPCRSVISNDDGTYMFEEIANAKYTVTEIDNSYVQNALIFANVSSVQ